jgi:hypothetical protein
MMCYNKKYQGTWILALVLSSRTKQSVFGQTIKFSATYLIFSLINIAGWVRVFLRAFPELKFNGFACLMVKGLSPVQ